MKLNFILFITTLSLNVSAQNKSCFSVMVMNEDQSPVKGVKVSFVQNMVTDEKSTDDSGKLSYCEFLAGDDFTIMIEEDPYQIFEREYTVSSNPKTIKIILIKKASKTFLTGFVTDSSNLPIKFADIHLKSYTKFNPTLSDRQGHYSLPINTKYISLKNKYTLHCIKEGYQPQQKQLTKKELEALKSQTQLNTNFVLQKEITLNTDTKKELSKTSFFTPANIIISSIGLASMAGSLLIIPYKIKKRDEALYQDPTGDLYQRDINFLIGTSSLGGTILLAPIVKFVFKI